MITTYRKGKRRDTWHWLINCRHWPKKNFDVTFGKPKSGELCNQCRSLERRGKGKRYPDTALTG